MSRSNKKKRRFLPVLIILLLIGGFLLYKVFGPATTSFTQTRYLYIRTGATYDDVKRSLKDSSLVADITSFDMLAKRAGLPQHIHAGKYKITPGMSNYNLIKMLGRGTQTPVKLVINKLRTKQDLIHLISANLEANADSVNTLLHDSAFLAAYNLDTNTAMCAIMPDTYEFYWNTSARKAFKKIAASYTGYWNDQRRQLAQSKNLTPQKAIIIASIVDEETNKNDEKPNIASVYMNRLKTGMRLQADPTVKFAVGDFTIRRITGAHLQINSPYNTYMYAGLPPGPICTPSKASIEAVLNAPDTKYIYFCAKEDFSGYHNFASNLADHLKNARLYQEALNAKGIH